MKRLFFITLLLVSFVLFSCKNDLSSDAQGSISFDTGSTADYISRSASQNIIALNASNNSLDETKFISYTIKVNISTEGDYSDSVENEYSKKLNELLGTANQDMAVVSFIKESLSQPISIKGIPVGSSIKVKLSIKNIVTFDKAAFKQSLSGEQLPQAFVDSLADTMAKETNAQNKTWNGESETFVVRRGENKVDIKLKGLKLSDYEYGGNEAGTNIVLYNSNALFSFSPNLLSSKRILSPTVYQVPDGFSDFAIDKHNNIYYIVFGDFDQDARETPYSIYKNESVIYSSGIGEQSEYKGFYLDQTTGLLFCTAVNGGGADESFAYDTNSGEIIYSVSLGISNIDFIYCLAISFDEPKQEGDTTVYEGYTFLANTMYNNGTNNSLQFKRIPIKYTISEQKKIETYGDALWTDLYSGAPVFTQTLSDNTAITDMIVQDNTLYALLREAIPLREEYDKNLSFNETEPKPIEMGVFKSRGALIAIDIEHFDDASYMKVRSDDSITTQRDISIPFNFQNPYTSSNDQGTINFEIYQPNENSSFFGPERFVAVKPGKLVIADDGYFFYNNNNQFHVKNINRIVEVDLNSDPFKMITTNLKTSLPIQFFYEQTDDVEIRCNVSNEHVTVTCVTDK